MSRFRCKVRCGGSGSSQGRRRTWRDGRRERRGEVTSSCPEPTDPGWNGNDTRDSVSANSDRDTTKGYDARCISQGTPTPYPCRKRLKCLRNPDKNPLSETKTFSNMTLSEPSPTTERDKLQERVSSTRGTPTNIL